MIIHAAPFSRYSDATQNFPLEKAVPSCPTISKDLSMHLLKLELVLFFTANAGKKSELEPTYIVIE